MLRLFLQCGLASVVPFHAIGHSRMDHDTTTQECWKESKVNPFRCNCSLNIWKTRDSRQKHTILWLLKDAKIKNGTQEGCWAEAYSPTLLCSSCSVLNSTYFNHKSASLRLRGHITGNCCAIQHIGWLSQVLIAGWCMWKLSQGGAVVEL